MFNNIGAQIKTLAKVFFVIGVVSCMIGLIIAIERGQHSYSQSEVPIWVAVALSGVGICLSSLFAYGFGELIDYAKAIDAKLDQKGTKADSEEEQKQVDQPAETKQVTVDYLPHAQDDTGSAL